MAGWKRKAANWQSPAKAGAQRLQQGISTYIGGAITGGPCIHGASVFIPDAFTGRNKQPVWHWWSGVIIRIARVGQAQYGRAQRQGVELREALEMGYAVGTAGAKATGRSQTVQLFHGLQRLLRPNANVSREPSAIPDFLPGTEIVPESNTIWPTVTGGFTKALAASRKRPLRGDIYPVV